MCYLKPIVMIAIPVAVILFLVAVFGVALFCYSLNEMLE